MPGVGSQIRCYILQSTLSKVDNFGNAVTMCPSSMCPSYRGSTKSLAERQGPTLGVHFSEGCVFRRLLVGERRLMHLALGMHLSLRCEYSMQVADGDDDVDGDNKIFFLL